MEEGGEDDDDDGGDVDDGDVDGGDVVDGVRDEEEREVYEVVAISSTETDPTSVSEDCVIGESIEAVVVGLE